MQQFRIESASFNHNVVRRVRSWGPVATLATLTISLFILGVSGIFRGRSIFGLMFVLSLLGTVIGSWIAAYREGIEHAERQMTFILDDSSIIRKRKGYADITISFAELASLSEERRYLIVRGIEPDRKLVISRDVTGYEILRAELERHCAISAIKRPLLKDPLWLLWFLLSIIAWGAVIWFSSFTIFISALAVALLSLVFATFRTLGLMHRGVARLVLLICLGFAWLAAIMVIYIRLSRLG